MKRQQGYILIVVLMILSLAMMLVTQLYRQGFVQSKFDKLMIEREQARLLAFSGIECARSELMYQPQEKDEKKPATAADGKQAAPKKDPNAAFKRMLPLLNRWQTFALKKETDGLNGSIKICVMSEAGKIPLNVWFDFKQRKFLNEGKDGDTKVYLQQIFTKLKTDGGQKDLFAPFEKYLKNKDTFLQDITQLLTIKEFRELFWNTQFYEPPTANDSAKRPVYLMDLFTLWGSSAQMSAWSLSDSVLSVLGLQRVQLNDVEKRSKLITTFFSKKESAPTALKDLWDAFFKDLYNKDFSGLPTGSDKILKTEFDSKVVSVLSYGTVGKVTYKLYGILQQVEKGEEKEYKLIHLYTL